MLEECARSGMTVQAFARKRGLVPERLYRWRRQLGASPSEPGSRMISLVPAQVIVGEATGAVVHVGEVAVEVGDASPAWVAALVRELVKPA